MQRFEAMMVYCALQLQDASFRRKSGNGRSIETVEGKENVFLSDQRQSKLFLPYLNNLV